MKGETGKQQTEDNGRIDGGLHPAVDGQSLERTNEQKCLKLTRKQFRVLCTKANDSQISNGVIRTALLS